MKKIITITVFKASSYYSEEWPPENLLKFRDWIDQQINSIPEEYKATATFEIENKDGNTHLTIGYNREETDEEEAERKRSEAERISVKERRERQMLAELKAKYEP